MAARKSTKPKDIPFAQQTALFHWMLRQLEAESWEKLPLTALKEAEGDDQGSVPSPFAEVLKLRLFPLQRLPHADLDRLDARVWEATAKVNAKRGDEPIRWKYFQYLGLLFTELYLERFFTDREKLREDLNEFLAGFNAERGLDLPPYGVDDETGADDLARLAFWQATGSGKTLLLHAHWYQYHAALERHGLKRPDQVLLITPNAGLSTQHLRECRLSGLRGAPVEKGNQGSLVGRSDIQVAEITRFTDKPGPTTLATTWFEGQNLVFVDEGHRGSSSVDGEWRKRRKALAGKGFCFEYSATFAQAARKDDSIRTEYGRSVLFDYAYRRFHGDGYGKHWRILNIRDQRFGQALNQRAYLTAALTVLVQQLRVFRAQPALAAEHNLAKPFGIFVGASVTKTSETAEQTDVMKVVKLLADLVHPRERAQNEALLGRLLRGELGFLNQQGHDIFHPETTFGEVKDQVDGATLYTALLAELCNASAPGLLHVQELKEASGELALSVGENPPFAVINVGDPAGVRRLCEDARYAGLIDVQEKAFKGSLFDEIDKAGSPLTLLIGSRKFTEGWSSWRVSVMGLLNLGKAPGTQIIQLFGRGVRLKGKDRSLKRASHRYGYAKAGSEEACLRVLETLSVFGVEANYMDQFEEELKAEGLVREESADSTVVVLPTARLDPLPALRVIRPPKVSFAESSERPVLGFDPRVGEIVVDAHARVQSREDPGARGGAAAIEKHAKQGPLDAFAFLDHQRLYSDLVRLKNVKSFTNLALPRVVEWQGREVPLTYALFQHGAWYKVAAPAAMLEVSSLRHKELWQQLASELACRYAERFYQQHRLRYQSQHSSVVWLSDLPPHEREKYLPDRYEVEIEQTEGGQGEALVAWVKALAEKVKRREFDDKYTGILESVGIGHHLYNPLLYLPKGGKHALRVVTRPTALNEGELAFVRDLESYLAKKPAALGDAEVYLLRNESRKGTGFFEIGGYYPDFMLWILKGGTQWLTFVDPKGMGRMTDLKGWAKIKLWETLQIIAAKNPGLGVKLDSWLVSVTPVLQAPVEFQDPQAAFGLHIVHQKNPDYVERMVAGILG